MKKYSAVVDLSCYSFDDIEDIDNNRIYLKGNGKKVEWRKFELNKQKIFIVELEDDDGNLCYMYSENNKSIFFDGRELRNLTEINSPYDEWIGELCLFSNRIKNVACAKIGVLNILDNKGFYVRHSWDFETNELEYFKYCTLATPENLELLKQGKLEFKEFE